MNYVNILLNIKKKKDLSFFHFLVDFITMLYLSDSHLFFFALNSNTAHVLFNKSFSHESLIIYKFYFFLSSRESFQPAKISSVVLNIPAKLFTTFSVVSSSLFIDCESGCWSGRGKSGRKKFGCKKNCILKLFFF